MSAHNFEPSLAVTLRHEGGFSSDRNDPGNWTGGQVGKGTLKGTKAGISAASYPTLDIGRLTDSQIAQIYRRDYWDRLYGDDLPLGVDLATFDYGVNSGRARAVKELQRCVGVTVDGAIGPATLGAVRRARSTDLVRALCDRRLSFLQGLSTFARYGKGWSSRVADIRARAVLMAAGGATAVRKDAVAAGAKSVQREKQAANAVAAGGISGGAAVGGAPLPSVDWSAVVGLGITAAVLIALFLILRSRARIHNEVAAAAEAVAREAEGASHGMA